MSAASTSGRIRWTVRWRSVSDPTSGRNGFGRPGGRGGQRRAPPPPARITTYMLGDDTGRAVGSSLAGASPPRPARAAGGVQKLGGVAQNRTIARPGPGLRLRWSWRDEYVTAS